MLLLSHHRPEAYHRTYCFLGVRVCARCLGLYPVLFAALAAQLATRAPLEWEWDALVALLLLPGLLDWAAGHLKPASGSNLRRTSTGLLLGISLGRTLFVHFQRPFHGWLLLQLGLVTAVALPVILASYRMRSARVDQPAGSNVHRGSDKMNELPRQTGE